MSVLKELTFKFKRGDLDGGSNPLQVLDTIHRATLMTLARGKQPAGVARFRDPTGIAAYNGFGADGWFYTGGVKGRIWSPGEVVDDFTDRVTDTERWSPIVSDLVEGGLDWATVLPFGRRLFSQYVGPAAEVYDREGKMVFAPVAQGVLSGRVTTRLESSPPVSVLPDNGMWLGIQPVGVLTDYVFVGFVNTSTVPFMVVHGEVIAGVPTIHGGIPLLPGTQEVEVAIEYDAAAGTSRAYFSLSQQGLPYNDPAWTALGPAVLLGPAWGATPAAVPRVHATYSAGAAPGERHSLSDVKVEAGEWEGQQRATWWLETQDGTNNYASALAECPDEVLVTWERNSQGETALALVNVDTPTDPRMWRRWPHAGIFSDWNRDDDEAFSPGWLDADEGHIVLTRNTKADVEGPGNEKGEIWLFSLRWDKVLVFNTDDVADFPSFYQASTGRILREASTWGARRWNVQQSYSPTAYFDRYQVPFTSLRFVGTGVNVNTETPIDPALTYGVCVRSMVGGQVYIGYGLYKRGTAPAYFAGLLHLDESNHRNAQYYRWLLSKDPTGYPLWQPTDEAWPVVGLSYDTAMWWLQGGEDGPFDEIDGALCRRDLATLLAGPDNLSTNPFVEDIFWRANDVFMGRGINLVLMDSDPVGDELVMVASGWEAGAHLAALWYDSGAPGSSIVKTFGVPISTQPVSYQMKRILISDEFPRWFAFVGQPDDAFLERCRLTGGAGVGSDSYVAVNDGFWSAYGHFKGVSVQTYRHSMLRGAAIDRSEFVLEVEGKLIPPFTAGYGFQALQYMSSNQRYVFMLGVRGEKHLRAGVMIRLSGGNGSTPGTVEVLGFYEHLAGGGQVAVLNTVPGPTIMFLPGALVHFRIQRTSSLWELLFYNQGTSTWQNLVEVNGLQCPVVPFLEVGINDSPGVEAGVTVEVDKMELAPLSLPLGKLFYRPVNYATVPSQLGSVGAGAVFREAVPTPGDGSIIVGDNWVFPGLLPRP